MSLPAGPPFGATAASCSSKRIVGRAVAELVGVGHGHAGPDRRLARPGADHHEIAAGVAGGQRADVAARRGLLDFHGHGLHVRADGRGVHAEEVEELVVLVQGVDDHADLPVGHLAGHGELARSARRPHRPADHLAEELVVHGLAGPVGGPACAGVAGEGHGLAQPVGPAGQERVVLVAGRLGRDSAASRPAGCLPSCSSSRSRSRAAARRSGRRGFRARAS